VLSPGASREELDAMLVALSPHAEGAVPAERGAA